MARTFRHLPVHSVEDSTANFEQLQGWLAEIEKQLEAPSSSTDTGWITAVLKNSWASNTTIAYRRVGNIVRLKGRAKSGTTGTVIFELPVGFRPNQQLLLAIGGGGPSIAAMVITTAGEVSLYDPTATTDVGLDGVTFTID